MDFSVSGLLDAAQDKSGHADFGSDSYRPGLEALLYSPEHDRYGILDRTPRPEYAADGSLDILIQADEPSAGPSNWLPAPRDEFQPILRAYQPPEGVVGGNYTPPPIENIGKAA